MDSQANGECGFLFDCSLLDRLKTKEQIADKANFLLRPLHADDYSKGYMNLLSQLTKVGDVDENAFRERFELMKQCKGSYYIIVIEDLLTGQVVGSTSLVIEYKFIRNTALKGRIEDVVVSSDYRGKQFGKLLVKTGKQLATTLGCYKLALECSDQMIAFYKSLGFQLEDGRSNYMTVRFSD